MKELAQNLTANCRTPADVERVKRNAERRYAWRFDRQELAQEIEKQGQVAIERWAGEDEEA